MILTGRKIFNTVFLLCFVTNGLLEGAARNVSARGRAHAVGLTRGGANPLGRQEVGLPRVGVSSVAKNLKIDPVAIFHAFDWTFDEIGEYLPVLQQAGYSHIQVSAIQGHRTTLPHTYEKDLKDALIKKFGDEEAIPPGYLDADGQAVKDAHGDDARMPWWLPYQPTSYEINSKYGTEREFTQLVTAAKERGLGIIVDVVFNHTAAVDGGEKKEWIEALNARANYGDDAPQYRVLMDRLLLVHTAFNKPEHFNEFKMSKEPYFYWDSETRRLERNESIATAFDLDGVWMAGALPSLNLENPEVQDAQENFLKKLLTLGVAGFRFDLVRFFKPTVWKRFNEFINEASNGKAFSYGELVVERDIYPHYSPYGKVSDHFFCRTLSQVFRLGGDLRKLRFGAANDFPDSITYAESHDQLHGRVGDRIEDEDDRRLATMYMIAREHGTPLILGEDHEKFGADIAQAIGFRRFVMKSPAESREYILDSETHFERADRHGITSKELLLMMRGRKGFMILNKTGFRYKVTLNLASLPETFSYPTDPIFQNGTFMQMGGERSPKNKGRLKLQNGRAFVSIPPRAAMFFVAGLRTSTV